MDEFNQTLIERLPHHPEWVRTATFIKNEAAEIWLRNFHPTNEPSPIDATMGSSFIDSAMQFFVTEWLRALQDAICDRFNNATVTDAITQNFAAGWAAITKIVVTAFCEHLVCKWSYYGCDKRLISDFSKHTMERIISHLA